MSEDQKPESVNVVISEDQKPESESVVISEDKISGLLEQKRKWIDIVKSWCCRCR